MSAPRSSNGEMSGCSHHGTTTVVGSGHSAINVVLALLDLQADAPRTEVLWALRSNRIEKLLGGGLNNQLPQRGELGLAAKEAIDAGRLRMLAPFAAERVTETGGRLLVEATLDGASVIEEVGRIVVATRSVLGPVDETLIAEVMATGASFDELREAWAWLNGDEALMNEGRPLPGTRVAALIDLLEVDEDE